MAKGLTSPVIRRFSISDFDSVVQIEESSFTSDAYTPSHFKDVYRQHSDGFLLAEISGKVVGYVIGYISLGKGQIDSIAIAPEFRRLGIGKVLANAIVEKFKKEGAKFARLEVSAVNEVAIQFYQELGFQIARTVRDYYQDRTDALIMTKNISADKPRTTDECL